MPCVFEVVEDHEPVQHEQSVHFSTLLSSKRKINTLQNYVAVTEFIHSNTRELICNSPNSDDFNINCSYKT